VNEPLDPNNFDGVVMTHERMFCPLHGEPFRAQYPKGVPIFMVKAFQIATGLESIWDEARRLSNTPEGESPHVKALELVLDVRPACCRVSRRQLFDLYVEAQIGSLRRCRACNRKKLGTPYQTRARAFDHLCFECVCSASETPQHVQ
jgi:hypothetical protein